MFNFFKKKNKIENAEDYYNYLIEESKERKSESLKESISDLSVAWKTMSFDEQRNIILEIIDKIVVDNNDIKIYYNI